MAGRRGLLREPHPDQFTIGRYPQPLAGNALVCGFDERGETVGTMLDVHLVRHVVRWAYDLPVEPACGFRSWPDFGTSWPFPDKQADCRPP